MATTTKARQIADDMKIARVSYNLEVLARYMSPAEIDAFNRAYESKLERFGTAMNRFNGLRAEITQQEKDILNDTLDEVSENSMTSIEEKYNLKPGTGRQKAANAALKYMFQNKIKL